MGKKIVRNVTEEDLLTHKSCKFFIEKIREEISNTPLTRWQLMYKRKGFGDNHELTCYLCVRQCPKFNFNKKGEYIGINPMWDVGTKRIYNPYGKPCKFYKKKREGKPSLKKL